MGLDLQRQSGIIPDAMINPYTATIVGCGAIGSHVAETFGKIGIRELVVYDFDTVETHNLPNQGYRLTDLGRMKSTALKDRLEEAIGIDVDARVGAVDENTVYTTPVVISAVDSMSARMKIWEGVRKSDEVKVFIDGRMGALYGQAYMVRMNREAEVDAYSNSLFPDSEGHQAPCTEKATIFCAAGLASWMTAMFTGHLLEEPSNAHTFLEVDFARLEVSAQKLET